MVQQPTSCASCGTNEAVWSSKFTRSAKKLARRKPELLDSLDAALQQLERDPYHPVLRTHKLSGDFAGCLVFEFIRPRRAAEMEVHLLNVGTHDEVY